MSQFIVYRVGKQKFAVSISSTSRIINLDGVTPVPDSTDFMMGVMEIEGDILPIIDLSKRFYDRPLTNPDEAQVLVLLWQDEEIGLAVDEVINIVDFEASQIDEQIEKFTKIGTNRELSPIKSFIRTDEGIILELNLDLFAEENKLLDMSDLIDLEELNEFNPSSNAAEVTAENE